MNMYLCMFGTCCRISEFTVYLLMPIQNTFISAHKQQAFFNGGREGGGLYLLFPIPQIPSGTHRNTPLRSRNISHPHSQSSDRWNKVIFCLPQTTYWVFFYAWDEILYYRRLTLVHTLDVNSPL